MKIVLAGSTGFIGQEVLQQCLDSSKTTSVVVLSRRQLPAQKDHDKAKKLRVVLVDDFLWYPDSVRDMIKDADAFNRVSRTLGKARMPDNETARRVSVDYTLAAVRALQETTENKIRFVYCSGAAAECDHNKPLWFMQEYRRIRGQVETELMSLAEAHPDHFDAYIMRPGMVMSSELTLRSMLLCLTTSVRVDVLAAAMLDLALDGVEKKTWENDEIIQANKDK
ncbi:hypothetical protein N7510_008056 [Penicillium lagena]|uniref:uncharacterized protein n=1 Tax=Penicillium lagena TaxID=94218 RepID=UPI0025410E69|nr:uncharacterized protein N7510_008056 [Penicillium lagena]KAJ5611337.1 hypothetical protein N7510_008056 [Penicillium lagena]